MSYEKSIWQLRDMSEKKLGGGGGRGPQAREDWLPIFTRDLYLAQRAADLLGWLLTPSPES